MSLFIRRVRRTWKVFDFMGGLFVIESIFCLFVNTSDGSRFNYAYTVEMVYNGMAYSGYFT